MCLITEDDLRKVEKYEDDYMKLKSDMFYFMRKYAVIDLLKVISEVFMEIKGE